MAVPITIFVVCLCVGVFASSRWLPSLQEGLVGGIAFFAVCGLLGAALAVVGLDVYGCVQQSEEFRGLDVASLATARLLDMCTGAGTLAGLALLVYLLAPHKVTAGPAAPGPESIS